MTTLRMLVMAMAVVAVDASAFEKKVRVSDLPPAVQAAIQEQTKGLQEFDVSEEGKNGKILYEVESKTNGMEKSVLIDDAGAIVEAEEEIDPDKLPDAARQAVERTAGGGTIKKVESVTKDGTTEYEVEVKSAGKKSTYLVKGDGTIRKE